MKGTNTMTLNQATMKEAVQFWLNSQWSNVYSPAPRVDAITEVGRGTFEVKLCESEEDT